MASYVVAASLFILGSSYLLHFVIEPPGTGTANLEHAELQSKGEQALSVILDTAGVPPAWAANATSIDRVHRLGLVQDGATIRIDPAKFEALARGKFSTASSENGQVDYAEAKAALGLDGYEFHLRAYPASSPASASNFYGMEEMGDFSIGYVGDFDGSVWQPSAQHEAAAIEAISMTFLNVTADNPPGDVFQDDPNFLRKHLLPRIGATIQQTVIGQGAGTAYDFYRVNKSVYESLAGDVNTSVPTDDRSTVMALSANGETLGYTKNRELRAIVGHFDMSGKTSARLDWSEWVDTDRGNLSYDCNDYGYIEVSPDNGATWYALNPGTDNRSQDCSSTTPVITPFGANMARKTIADITYACPSQCRNVPTLLLAFHWVADNDNNIGYGWIVDDVQVTSGGETLLSKTFQAPEYDMLVIGSNVDHNAFTPAAVKDAIRDYVAKHGGRLVVVGQSTNTQWLDRLFDAGIGGGSGGLSTPDTTHPLLTLPNELDYTGYARGQSWDFSNSDDGGLFQMIIGESQNLHVLSVSKSGAFGDGTSKEGSVILSSYEPYRFSDREEARRFFANAAVYGKYHYLYLEAGPQVPEHEAVASVARSATMNKYREGAANYTEMVFVIYVWPGDSVSGTLARASVNPTPPQGVTAEPSDGRVYVNFTRPTSNGTGAPQQYFLYRGHAPGFTSLHATIPYTTDPVRYEDTLSIENGKTYYYNISLNSSVGNGTSSSFASATPLALPGEPQSLAATSGINKVTVTWAAPSATGPGTIYGYAVYANNSDSSGYELIGEVGNVTRYDHALAHELPMTYKVAALNARGWGPQTSGTASAAADVVQPVAAPTLNVTSTLVATIQLTWVAPGDLLGQTLQGYRVWRADDAAGPFTQLVYLNSAANVSFDDKNVLSGQTKWYKVQAVTNYGDGLNSTTEGATAVHAVDAPTLTVAQGVGPNNLTLTWVAPGDLLGQTLQGYRIWRADTSGGTYAQLVQLNDPANVSFMDVGLGASVTKWYKIQAVTNAGAGLNSTAGSATTMAVPSAPTGLTATELLGNATIAWVASPSDSPVVRYDLYRGATAEGATEFVKSVTAAELTTTTAHDAAKPWYRVKAVSAAGESGYSNADSP